MGPDPFQSQGTLRTGAGDMIIYRLHALEKARLTELERLPVSIRVLLESILRQQDGHLITQEHVTRLAAWKPYQGTPPDVPYRPSRVLMQDFTGVPAVVDLAAMRSAVARANGDPSEINPVVPVDLVIDHSVQVDFFGTAEAFKRNVEIEFQRNRERYSFLRWGQDAFSDLRVVPPAAGIVHQVNLEYLASVVTARQVAGKWWAFPDTLVGTDSHTPMVNSLGVLGWGVGGIEAEAAILGQPLVIVAPDVVGVRLHGELSEGATATDLVLTITQILRQHGVVGKFVEFTGPGLSHLSTPDRATIANMAPEYGATIGFFPVDDETLRYLEITGRDRDHIDLVERYCKTQGLFRTDTTPEAEYSEVLELDLGTVGTCLAGPKLPHSRIALSQAKAAFEQALSAPSPRGGFALLGDQLHRTATIPAGGRGSQIGHGAVVIAAITSCTNTSNPSVMVAAGLLARNAVQRGLKVKPYVKTSLAPGSLVVTAYLQRAGLLEPLGQLGFELVGYGCTTCIGNSGPLPERVSRAIDEHGLVAAAVLSGNRNYEGRIHPQVQASYLASPPLVVAYALAGSIDVDLLNEPLGSAPSGEAVFLRDIWPSQEEIRRVVQDSVSRDMFRERYRGLYTSNEMWNAIPVKSGSLYDWPGESTYIQEPPFFVGLSGEVRPIEEIRGARVLGIFGDALTTDHISPAGAIPVDSPAGEYLVAHGVQPGDFNSFGSRRGNDRVMVRGTFGNIRIKNLMLSGREGGNTIHQPSGEEMSIFEAAMRYRREGVPLILLAGEMYGCGSSRDWAAKGTSLLGVKAVLARSYERIHRSNLVGMGVLPLQFLPGDSVQDLRLTGEEEFDVLDLHDDLRPGDRVRIHALGPDGSAREFGAQIRIDTPVEVQYYRNGGILHTVLQRLIREVKR
jgi:aconitate hydratase